MVLLHSLWINDWTRFWQERNEASKRNNVSRNKDEERRSWPTTEQRLNFYERKKDGEQKNGRSFRICSGRKPLLGCYFEKSARRRLCPINQ